MTLAALVAVSTLAAACASTPKWTESTLSLQAEGIVMNGDQIGGGGWVGTGFWIDHNLLATNAHVATRALRLVGIDDDGQKYHFDTLVALDREADIAILRSDRPGDKEGVEFIDRPTNPKDLRGRAILMVGNSGGLGLGFFDGRVTNVLGDPGSELILHNATVVGGSSGSAIYDKEEHKVIGIHHSGSPSLDTKIASAAWRIQSAVAEAKKRKGVALGDLFTIPNIAAFANIWGQREFCLAPGQSYKVSFDAPRATDVLGYVKQASESQIMLAGLVMGGQQVVWKAAFKGTIYLPFSLSASGPYELIVIAPEDGPALSCGAVGAGEITWEKGIQ
jgi:hypothetical protein